jgi:hypothetical protein
MASEPIPPEIVAAARREYIAELRRRSPEQPESWYERQADSQPMFRHPERYPWQFAHLMPRARRRAERPSVMSKLVPPFKSFTTAGGRRFTIGPGEHEERFPGDDRFWSDTYPIFHGKKEVGKLYRNLNYGEGPHGPRWGISGKLTWMLKRKESVPLGLGFDVVGKDTAELAVLEWGRNADRLLDWDEGKIEVRNPWESSGRPTKQKSRRGKKSITADDIMRGALGKKR